MRMELCHQAVRGVGISGGQQRGTKGWKRQDLQEGSKFALVNKKEIGLPKRRRLYNLQGKSHQWTSITVSFSKSGEDTEGTLMTYKFQMKYLK